MTPIEAALLDQERRLLEAHPSTLRDRRARRVPWVACGCGRKLSLAENRGKPTWTCRACRER